MLRCSHRSWFHSRIERVGNAIRVPPLKGDPLRCSTVLPYLESYHYNQTDGGGARDDDDEVYYTEHDLSGK